MPHTRAARFRPLKEAAESRDMLQMQNPTSVMGWNDYLDWDLPGSTYQLDSPAWFLNEGTASDQPQFFTDTRSPVVDAANCLPESNSEKASNCNFYGLQSWYSTGTREFSAVSPTATARPQLSGSEFNSYASTSLEEENQPTDHSYSSQPWSPNISCRLSSVSDESLTRIPSKGPIVDLTQEQDGGPSHSSEDEDVRRSAAGVDVSKKRKIAHSVVEKKYRSKINDGMVELRHCVPSTARRRSSIESKRASGKVATLSDAVQYVKSLQLEHKSLHGRLDVMQRRNNMLQKIALSKADTNTPSTSINMEEIGKEGVGKQEKQRNSSLIALRRVKQQTVCS